MSQGDRLHELTEHIQALRRYALALTRDRHQAEDLVQECLTRAIAAADKWRPDVSLRPWLFRILHNVHISQHRKRQVRDETTYEDEDAGGMDGDQMARLELRDVLAAIDRLPEGQREAVVLMALEDLPYQEAAKILNVPLGTFMSRLARGRKTLRAIVNGEPVARLRVVGGSS